MSQYVHSESEISIKYSDQVEDTQNTKRIQIEDNIIYFEFEIHQIQL